MKKTGISFFVLAAAVAAVFLLSGCSARSSASPGTFRSAAEKAGYTVSDSTSSADGAQSYLTATDDNGSELYFVEFADSATSQKVYNGFKDQIQTGGNKAKNVDSSPYSKYSVTNGELYYAVCRIDTTVLYGKCTAANRNAMEKLFDSIHY